MRRAVAATILLAGALGADRAVAHGGQPQVLRIEFPAQLPGAVWALTDNQGLYARRPDGVVEWLCEDAVAPGAGVRSIGVLGAAGERWLLSTEEGAFFTFDNGCGYHPAPPPLTHQSVRAISVHPTRPHEAVVVTDAFELANDVFRTTDGGWTWTPAGEDARGRFRQLLRAPANPERLWALADVGALTSADGGRTWSPFAVPAEARRPADFTLLGGSPADGDVLFAAVEQFPETLVLRSEDAGARWAQVTTVPDFPLTFVMNQAGRDALLLAPFEGLRRSADGGRTWVAEPTPVERLGCLTRQPGSDRLWGCTQVFFGGPWVLGRSDDFGRTWRGVFERFEAVARWSCPGASRAEGCCDHLCPGEPPAGTCPEQAPSAAPYCDDPLPALPPIGPLPDAGLPEPDAAVVVDGGPADAAPPSDAARPDAGSSDAAPRDAGLDAEGGPDASPDAAPAGDAAPITDAAPRRDARPARDARPPGGRRVDAFVPYDLGFDARAPAPPAATRDDEGCRALPGRGAPAAPALLVVMLLWGARRRRR